MIEMTWTILEGAKKPMIECPQCGGFLLGDTCPHGIKADGVVYESVVCPCGWHNRVKLLAWQGGEIQKGQIKKP